MLVARQLLLLLWKGSKLRMRHFIVTGLEVVVPLLLICVMVYVRSLIPVGLSAEKKPARTFNSYEIGFYSYSSDQYILYTPDSPLTKELVTMVKQEFDSRSRYDKMNIEGATDEGKLYDRATEMVQDDLRPLGLVFENIKPTDTELPQSLKYKIRISARFNTDTLEPYGSYFSTSDDDYYYNSPGFLAVQYSVDKAFRNMTLQGKNQSAFFDPEIKIQKYVYPSHYDLTSFLSFMTFLPMIINQSFIFMAVVFVKRMVDEKANRAKELMRMMGMNDFVYFAGNWLMTYLMMAFLMSLTVILFKIPLGHGQRVIDNSDGFLVWIILMFYAATSLLFCMLVSTFFNRPVIAAIVTYIVWTITYTLPAFLLDNPVDRNSYLKLSLSAKMAISLMPNAALHYIFKIMSFYELTGGGATWSNLGVPNPGDNLSVGMVLGMMFVSCVVCIILIWYVDNVWPWQFGIPKHPLYFAMPSYWFPRRNVQTKEQKLLEEDDGEMEMVDNNHTYFEEEPRAKATGIAISRLTKAFGWGSTRKVAVKDVSLNIYHGEITALLGHNGAGKTTTLNVITGLYPPSSGTATVNGYSVLDNLKQARISLGLCPQHNVLYEDLTVEEHLILFAGLKGLSFSEMKKDINTTLDLLQLIPKRNDLAKTLSGGMKRKLSLGIAMIGGSKVLVLDEPTSGMDPQARRVIWDLMNRIKQDRTIVLTTHYMEEADILGDRIAIMAEGVVQCCGSPLFLKKKFGAGYHLRVSKGDSFKEEHLRRVVQSSVPTAYVDTDMRSEVSYVLPVTDSQPFVNMFESLENQKNQIGYTACGLTITTMEDVFIKVGQIAEKSLTDNHDMNHQGGSLNSRPEFMIDFQERLVGFSLWLQQFKGLVLKRFHDSKRYLVFLAFLVVLPLVITFVMLHTKNAIFSLTKDTIQPLPLNMESIFGKTHAFYSTSVHSPEVDDFKKRLADVYHGSGANSESVKNITEAVLNYVDQDNLQKYKEIIVGGQISKNIRDDIRLTCMFTGSFYHTSPMSLNLMDVALHRAATGNDGANIIVTNAPLPLKDDSRRESGPYQDNMSRMIISIFLPLALSFLSASFVLFPIHERQNKSKLIQRMTGVDGLTFWASHFVWDLVMHLAASCFILIPFATMDTFKAYAPNTGALGFLFVMLLLYGWASIPFSYLLSFISNKPSTGFIAATAINFLAGMVSTLGVTIYKSIVLFTPNKDHSETVAWFLRIFPSFAMTWGTGNLDILARAHAKCEEVKQGQMPSPDFDPLLCARGLASMEASACGRDMLFMFLAGIIFFGILGTVETNLVRFWYRVRDRKQGVPQPQFQQNTLMAYNSTVIAMPGTYHEDPDVAAERARVEQLAQTGQSGEEALIVRNLTKYFGNINAVEHVTFSVHKDECFGLLGVNGAGKTTTFHMLTGDLTIGEGTATIGPYSVRDDLTLFQRQIGYCPQFDALLDRLTGREALYLFARLRGIPENKIPKIVSSLIDVVDLQKHADKTAEKYSGGNRRKLSLALSLVGSPPVVFLDEPTAGVDPASRRKIWSAFVQVQQSGGTSFILTTHSMEECEALCGRLVIMVNGQFRCLGPIQYLKSKFGQGYTIIVKLNKEQHLDPQASQAVQQFFQQTFPGSVLKDVHEGMLHYHITDNRYTWSQMFREMERAKDTFRLEDYFVSDTTLEQIFLTFARAQRLVASP